MIDIIQNMGFTIDHIDYYFYMLLMHLILWINRNTIISVAKGYNGKFQKAEITWLFCSYFFLCYAGRIIYMGVDSDEAFLLALLTGAGIGIHYGAKKSPESSE